ncbi:C39 family peptidase [Candidatus Pacearchaeota archaeon]|nr:C39 family peptidase [Candidatus Pacearchaeota archaeon]
MLNVRLMNQTTSYCGPFCLKMVFDYYGHVIDLKDIANVAKTTVENGTSPVNMVNTARHFGFDVSYKENSNLKELRRLVVKERIPVIIDWFDNNDGHYSIVVGLDKKNIYFADSDGGHHKKMTLKTFMRVWFDFTGSYMKSASDLRLRPIIVIRDKK